jgi:hypothetical protein
MDDIDRIQGQMKNFRKKIDKLKIRDAVMESLQRPVYKFQLKGRNKENDYVHNKMNDFFVHEEEAW